MDPTVYDVALALIIFMVGGFLGLWILFSDTVNRKDRYIDRLLDDFDFYQDERWNHIQECEKNSRDSRDLY